MITAADLINTKRKRETLTSLVELPSALRLGDAIAIKREFGARVRWNKHSASLEVPEARREELSKRIARLVKAA
jgi:hypothetical protein